jgi:hypothetical protein
LDAGAYSAPVFAKMDGDSDWDMFGGIYAGTFVYYENTGTISSPTFTERTGAANPLDGFDVGRYGKPAILDMDCDGDWDVVSGRYAGTFLYYENTGTVSSPAFTARTGGANPMDVFDVGYSSNPAVVDIDGDGDTDIISGEENGTFNYYRASGTCSFPLPIELIHFSADISKENENTICVEWITASEVNNDYFIVERSTDLIDWMTIAKLPGAGNSTQLLRYGIIDEDISGGQQYYYRLKQLDFNGAFSYSQICTVKTLLNALHIETFSINGQLKVNIESPFNSQADLSIINMEGKILKKEPICIFEGSQIFNYNIQSFSSGSYTLVVTSVGNVYTDRFIIFSNLSDH